MSFSACVRILPVCLASMAFPACAYSARPFITNATGAELVVQVDRDGVRRDVRVPDGDGRALPVADAGEGWRIEVIRRECRMTYELPSASELIGSRRGSLVRIQIEPDLTVHLVPQDVDGVVDVSAFSAVQEARFPLSPITQRCTR